MTRVCCIVFLTHAVCVVYVVCMWQSRRLEMGVKILREMLDSGMALVARTHTLTNTRNITGWVPAPKIIQPLILKVRKDFPVLATEIQRLCKLPKIDYTMYQGWYKRWRKRALQK